MNSPATHTPQANHRPTSNLARRRLAGNASQEPRQDPIALVLPSPAARDCRSFDVASILRQPARNNLAVARWLCKLWPEEYKNRLQTSKYSRRMMKELRDNHRPAWLVVSYDDAQRRYLYRQGDEAGDV